MPGQNKIVSCETCSMGKSEWNQNCFNYQSTSLAELEHYLQAGSPWYYLTRELTEAHAFSRDVVIAEGLLMYSDTPNYATSKPFTCGVLQNLSQPS